MSAFDADALVVHLGRCDDCAPASGAWCPVGRSLTSMLDEVALADIEAFHGPIEGETVTGAQHMLDLRQRDRDGTPTTLDLESWA